MTDILIYLAITLLFIWLYLICGGVLFGLIDSFDDDILINMNIILFMVFWPFILIGYPIIMLISYLTKKVKFRKKTNMTRLLNMLSEASETYGSNVEFTIFPPERISTPYIIRITKNEHAETIRFSYFNKNNINNDVVRTAIEDKIKELEEKCNE